MRILATKEGSACLLSLSVTTYLHSNLSKMLSSYFLAETRSLRHRARAALFIRQMHSGLIFSRIVCLLNYCSTLKLVVSNSGIASWARLRAVAASSVMSSMQ